MEDDKEIGNIDIQEDEELTNLQVIPKRRREGIAEILVRCGEAVAMELGYGRIYATIGMDNDASKNLWMKRKYKQYMKFEKRL